MAIELNGVSNIKILIESLYGTLKNESNEQFLDDAKEELELLERYLVAFADNAEGAANAAEYFQHAKYPEPPKWHEVKANPMKFPTLREIVTRKK